MKFKYNDNNDKEEANKINNKYNTNEDNNNKKENINPNKNRINNNNINNSIFKKYIIHKFIHNFRNKLNIDNNEVIKIEVKGDVNCFMRSIALFVFNNENFHFKIREKIYNYLEEDKQQFEHLEIEAEVCISNIDVYTKYIKKQNSWRGNLKNMWQKNYIILIQLIILKLKMVQIIIIFIGFLQITIMIIIIQKIYAS